MMRSRAGSVAVRDAAAPVPGQAAHIPVRTSGAPKRILLVGYHFPPSAAVGGLRMARFARFLPEFHCEPYVLTVRDADRDQNQGNDATRLTGLENVLVVRTHSRSGRISALYRRIKRFIGRQRLPEAAQVGPHAAGVHVNGDEGVRHETLIHRFKRYVTSLVLLLPDEYKGWSFASAWTAVRMVRQRRIDWVLTSGPPFSVHLIGLIVKIFTGARWLADFRDPWVEMLPERFEHTRSLLSEQIETWMEAAVIRSADKVLTTNELLRRSMIARYPSQPAAKFQCIPNGIDPGQVTARAALEKERPLTITYTGSLYFERSPEPLFAALGGLVRDGIALPSDFRVKLVGHCAQIGSVDTLQVARQHGIEESVDILDWLPRADAVALMQSSHLVLVLAPPNHRLMLPAKIFDYLGSGSKILAIAEPGATTEFMRETGCGSYFAGNDVEGLKDYLRELLQGGRYKYLRNDPATFARYDARSLSRELADIISAR